MAGADQYLTWNAKEIVLSVLAGADQYLTWNAKEIVLSVLAGADTRDRPITYSRKSILPDPSCRQYK